MSFKKNKLYSIINSKCPRCHEGDFFETKNPYNLKKFDKRFSHCSTCGENFYPEPGYYQGAMYVSYGLSVGLGIFMFLLMCVIFSFDEFTFLITFLILQIILSPVFYRISRLVWINFFVKYDLKASDKNQGIG